MLACMLIVDALVPLRHLECLNNDLNLGHFLSIVDLEHPWPNFLMHLKGLHNCSAFDTRLTYSYMHDLC